MELTGERILLREFAEGDVGSLLAVHSDPRVLRYYAPEVGTPEHARMLVEMFIRWASENPRQNFQFAIIDLETNALLGSCGIRRKSCPPNQRGDWKLEMDSPSGYEPPIPGRVGKLNSAKNPFADRANGVWLRADVSEW